MYGLTDGDAVQALPTENIHQRLHKTSALRRSKELRKLMTVITRIECIGYDRERYFYFYSKN